MRKENNRKMFVVWFGNRNDVDDDYYDCERQPNQ